MDPIKVVISSFSGICFGVDRAISLAQKQHTPILGPLVHNPSVVRSLEEEGIRVFDRYPEIKSLQQQGVKAVTITAHGYPKSLKEELGRAGFEIHDATCPVLLDWVYKKIMDFEEAGFKVILVGNPKHAEIIASSSYGKDVHVVYSEADISALSPYDGDVVALCQTTIQPEVFRSITTALKESRFPNLEIVDTRCNPVRIQQLSVELLSRDVDRMIIIGGFNSSNTASLLKIAKVSLGDNAIHIENAGHIPSDWLDGAGCIGVGAGTSTPKDQIKVIVDFLKSHFKNQSVVVVDQRPPPRPKAVISG